MLRRLQVVASGVLGDDWERIRATEFLGALAAVYASRVGRRRPGDLRRQLAVELKRRAAQWENWWDGVPVIGADEVAGLTDLALQLWPSLPVLCVADKAHASVTAPVRHDAATWKSINRNRKKRLARLGRDEVNRIGSPGRRTTSAPAQPAHLAAAEALEEQAVAVYEEIQAFLYSPARERERKGLAESAAARVLGDRTLAPDVLSQLHLEAHRFSEKIDPLSDPRQARHYLRSAVRWAALHAKTRNAREDLVDTALLDEYATPTPALRPAPTATRPFQSVAGRSRNGSAAAATIAGIARATRRSVATVHKVVHDLLDAKHIRPEAFSKSAGWQLNPSEAKLVKARLHTIKKRPDRRKRH